MKCPWSCWIEKWITRKRSSDARAIACRSAPNMRGERSDGRPGVARIVTCTGKRGSTLGRVTCGMQGRPRGFRPAPLRAPPHVLAAAIGSRICPFGLRSIPRMFRFRRGWPRVAWRVHLIRRMLAAGWLATPWVVASIWSTDLLREDRMGSRGASVGPADVTNDERRRVAAAAGRHLGYLSLHAAHRRRARALDAGSRHAYAGPDPDAGAHEHRAPRRRGRVVGPLAGADRRRAGGGDRGPRAGPVHRRAQRLSPHVRGE